MDEKQEEKILEIIEEKIKGGDPAVYWVQTLLMYHQYKQMVYLTEAVENLADSLSGDT